MDNVSQMAEDYVLSLMRNAGPIATWEMVLGAFTDGYYMGEAQSRVQSEILSSSPIRITAKDHS